MNDLRLIHCGARNEPKTYEPAPVRRHVGDRCGPGRVVPVVGVVLDRRAGGRHHRVDLEAPLVGLEAGGLVGRAAVELPAHVEQPVGRRERGEGAAGRGDAAAGLHLQHVLGAGGELALRVGVDRVAVRVVDHPVDAGGEAAADAADPHVRRHGERVDVRVELHGQARVEVEAVELVEQPDGVAVGAALLAVGPRQVDAPAGELGGVRDGQRVGREDRHGAGGRRRGGCGGRGGGGEDGQRHDGDGQQRERDGSAGQGAAGGQGRSRSGHEGSSWGVDRVPTSR